MDKNAIGRFAFCKIFYVNIKASPLKVRFKRKKLCDGFLKDCYVPISCQEKINRKQSFYVDNQGAVSECNYADCNFNRQGRVTQSGVICPSLYTTFGRKRVNT